jgi:DNA-binding HxlR family transcriptional regulator
MKFTGALADRDRWSATDCSLDGTLAIIGTRSAMLLMREAHYGTTRFEDFVRRIGITEAVAASRLRELVAAGLLVRRAYKNPGERTRHEYVLTEAGADLRPVLMALVQWGDRHLPRAAGPPLAFEHSGCEAPITVRVSCEAGHDVEPGEITVRASRARRGPATA